MEQLNYAPAMVASAPDGSTATSPPAPPPRALSVDVLRGLVMFTMVFVNDVHGPGVPSWMKHFHGKSGMTFVDVVFPAFLFIVGISIPLAIDGRRRRGDAWLTVYGHVLLRPAGLLFPGVLMVNDPDDAKVGWRPGVWSLLMYAGGILAFVSLPAARRPTARYILWGVRALGLALLIFLAVKFRDE